MAVPSDAQAFFLETKQGTGGGIARGLAVDTEPKVIQRAVKALSGNFV